MVRKPGITSILQHVEFTFDDGAKQLKLNIQEIISYDMAYTRNSPVLYGYFCFNDYHDVLTNVDIKNCSIEVYFNDLFNSSFLRRFKVLEMSEHYTATRSKIYMLFIMDEISYALSNIYVSKSFSGSRVSALKSIFEEYKIPALLSKTNLKMDFASDSGVQNTSFVLTTNMSVLDFFMAELQRVGYSFYQTRDGIYIKSYDDLLPSKLPEVQGEFTQETSNQLYKNIILEVQNSPGSNSVAMNNPNKKSFYFDETQKRMVVINDTFSSLKGDLSMNNDSRDLQENSGNKASFQNRADNAQHKNQIRERFLENFKIEMIVNGYMHNDINKIYSVQLQGHKGTAKTQIEGNIISSGKYVSLCVSDKLIGDKLIQKITLGRSDSQK